MPDKFKTWKHRTNENYDLRSFSYDPNSPSHNPLWYYLLLKRGKSTKKIFLNDFKHKIKVWKKISLFEP